MTEAGHAVEPSPEVRERLKMHQEDFTRVTGRPFQHFHCPILCRDEETEWCMGHVVNDAIPNSSGARVVQRKDVDGFYAEMFEGDFVALVKARTGGLRGVMTDPSLSNKLRPRFMADGKECGHYVYRGHKSPAHSGIALHIDDNEPIPVVLKASPEEVAGGQRRHWQIAVEMDFRVAAHAIDRHEV